MKILRDEVINDTPTSGNMFDMFDSAIYTLFNITSDELDTICKLATDEEMDTFVSGMGTIDENATFTERRKALEIRNKYISYYQ